MKKNILLISLDVDGTLLDNKGSLPLENLRVLNIAQNAGIKVLLNTGKPLGAIETEVDLLDIKGPIITLAGSMTLSRVSAKNYSLLNQIPIDECDFLNLAKAIVQTKVSVIMFTQHFLYVYHNKRNREYINFFQNLNASTNMPGMVEISKRDFVTSSNLELPIIKEILICDDNKELDKVVEIYELVDKGKLNLIRSSPGTMDIYSKKSGKLQALKFVCEYLRIKSENVLAMGDYDTDLDVVKWAGIGAIMQNAPKHVLEQAPLIAPSNNNCGVAKFIMQQVFEN